MDELENHVWLWASNNNIIYIDEKKEKLQAEIER